MLQYEKIYKTMKNVEAIYLGIDQIRTQKFALLGVDDSIGCGDCSTHSANLKTRFVEKSLNGGQV